MHVSTWPFCSLNGKESRHSLPGFEPGAACADYGHACNTHATYLYMHACTSLRFCLHPCMGCLRPQLFVSWRQTTWSPKLCHVVMRHEVSHILGRRLFGSGPWGPESISVVAGDLQAWCQPPARRTGGRITHGGGGPPWSSGGCPWLPLYV